MTAATTSLSTPSAILANHSRAISSEILIDCGVIPQSTKRNPQPSSTAAHRATGLADWQIKKIIRHVDSNIRLSLRIADLGRLVHLSASHFSRNFKISFGEPPYSYVLSRRIALAKDLIDRTDEPLSQIAHACGMSDQAHLCKLFRRIAGTTPHQWRQRTDDEPTKTSYCAAPVSGLPPATLT